MQELEHDARPIQKINSRVVRYYEAAGSGTRARQDKKGALEKGAPDKIKRAKESSWTLRKS